MLVVVAAKLRWVLADANGSQLRSGLRFRCTEEPRLALARVRREVAGHAQPGHRLVVWLDGAVIADETWRGVGEQRAS